MRAWTILNPNAGAVQRNGLDRARLAALLRDAGVDGPVHETASAEDAAAAARAAVEDGADALVAVGGDGTVHTIAPALAATPTALGIVPLGTANNLAYSLGIPLEFEAAIAALAAARPRPIDLGEVNGVAFTEACGIGFHAEAFEAYDPEQPRSVVRGALAVAKILVEIEPVTVALTLDGERLVREVVQATIANTPWYGPRLRIAAAAQPDDGWLDVVIVGPMAKTEMLAAAAGAAAGRPVDARPAVEARRARHVRLEGDPALAVHADAEIAGALPAEVRVRPRALAVLVPDAG